MNSSRHFTLNLGKVSAFLLATSLTLGLTPAFAQGSADAQPTVQEQIQTFANSLEQQEQEEVLPYTAPSVPAVLNFFRDNRAELASRVAQANALGTNLFIAQYPSLVANGSWGLLYDLQVMADFYRWSSQDLQAFLVKPEQGVFTASLSLANAYTHKQQLIPVTAVLNRLGVNVRELVQAQAEYQAQANQAAYEQYMASLDKASDNDASYQAVYRAIDDSDELAQATNSKVVEQQRIALNQGEEYLVAANTNNQYKVATMEPFALQNHLTLASGNGLTLESASYYIGPNQVLVYTPSVSQQVNKILANNRPDATYATNGTMLAQATNPFETGAVPAATPAPTSTKVQFASKVESASENKATNAASSSVASQAAPAKKATKVSFAGFSPSKEETPAVSTEENTQESATANAEAKPAVSKVAQAQVPEFTTDNFSSVSAEKTQFNIPNVSVKTELNAAQKELLAQVPGFAQIALMAGLNETASLDDFIAAGQKIVAACDTYADFQYNTAKVEEVTAVDIAYNMHLDTIRQANLHNKQACNQARANLQYVNSHRLALQYLLNRVVSR
ncbi:hypothetical protein [Psittacicella hinzii]|uniref:Outer membrane efflux protein n=1 Tax=Psittacicella hinzii TaxID=2028575 RepID=A0A3A1YSU3_9GAMM|nr:hypothetical protein [Psittacicella hinzii]RIY40319.1 hypothetical protein CKF58_00710 [Psittacicella hinzii]